MPLHDEEQPRKEETEAGQGEVGTGRHRLCVGHLQPGFLGLFRQEEVERGANGAHSPTKQNPRTIARDGGLCCQEGPPELVPTPSQLRGMRAAES